MDFPASVFPAKPLSRRQFGVFLGGGAVLLVAGGTYGVVARSVNGNEISLPASFGNVTILRAGRFARLDSQGRPAVSNLAAAASYLSGRVPRNAPRAGVQVPGATPGSGSHGHGGGVEDPGLPQPVNLTWGDVVVLEIELRNAGKHPVLFSPGQLRLKLSEPDVTVTPQGSNLIPGTLAAYATGHVLVSYLAPHAVTHFELEFTDDQHDQPRLFPLPPLTMTEVFS